MPAPVFAHEKFVHRWSGLVPLFFGLLASCGSPGGANGESAVDSDDSGPSTPNDTIRDASSSTADASSTADTSRTFEDAGAEITTIDAPNVADADAAGTTADAAGTALDAMASDSSASIDASGASSPADDASAGWPPNPGCRPASGVAIPIEPRHVRKLNCSYSFSGVPDLTLRAEAEYDLLFETSLSQCDGLVQAADIDFNTSMVFVASVAQRPDAEFAYAVRSDEGIVIGLHAPAYCGGAAPPSSVFLIELPQSEDEVSHEVCYTGDCGDGPFPP